MHRKQPDIMTPQQFKQRWERVDGDRLVAFPGDVLSDVRLPADVRAFLIEAGLPEDAAPFLHFTPPKSGTLPRVSAVYQESPAFDRYRIIGGNGSGDPVCLDEDENGQVVCLKHDNEFERVLVASSVFTLAECLTQLRDLVHGAGGDTALVTGEQYWELLERFHAIDPAACEPDEYWPQEIATLEPPENKKWWQVWK